ncbi:AAA family ATPase [Macrococcus bovicus]|uniref:ATPase n=1 Tax=Macrococcus bovicus TaxID=69968 RepID=A0A4R6C352_9STAP|nr:AAA family ATPase [Macrococcus bovicus]TDM15718.1 ATPase [Macrococcus bovicus]
MKLTLLKLAMDHFAGLKSKGFDFDGKDAAIYGANAAGKTTTAVALQWLLFDKNLAGKTINVVPVDENNQEQYERVPTVTAEFDMDGQKLVLRKESHPKYSKNQMTGAKEYTKSRTSKQYINDVPTTITNYKKEIANLIDENIFKLVTNPQSFNDLHWSERRKMLFEICGNVSDEDIIEGNSDLHPLKKYLEGKKIEDQKKVVKDKLAKTNADIEDIPVRINEAQKSIIEVRAIDEEELHHLQQLNKQLEAEIVDIENGVEEVRMRNEISELRGQLAQFERNHDSNNHNKVLQLKSKLDLSKSNQMNINSQLKRVEDDIEDQKRRRTSKLAQYKELTQDIELVHQRTFTHDDEQSCPCCGQEIPEAQKADARQKALEHFNQDKSQTLENLQRKRNEIKQQGATFKPAIAALEKKKETLDQQSADIQREIDSLNIQITDAENKISDVTQTDEYNEILQKIADINRQRNEISKVNAEKIAELQQKIDTNNREISFMLESQADIKANARSTERVKNLREEEERLVEVKEELHYQLHLIDQFNQSKVKTIENTINDKFKMARFKLFDELKNGNIEETCITTVDGVEYDKGLNNAARINVGLDIINTLSKHFDFYAPIFIDNAESVTDVLETESQQIKLIVSEKDEELRLTISQNQS